MILRIKEAAKERALTLSVLAKKLGIHRSNMSAIASGARGASLKMLDRICRILDIGLDELVHPQQRYRVFKTADSEAALDNIEKLNYDGIDKSWVSKVMLFHQMHYKKARKAK